MLPSQQSLLPPTNASHLTSGFPAVLDLLRACAEDRLDDALRKWFVRSEADRALRGIVSIEHVAQRAQRRTAPDEQRGMTLGCPETRQRVPVQLEEGHAVTNVLHGFGVELLDLPSELFQRGAVRCGDGGEEGVDAFILLGGRGHNRSIKTEGTSPVPEIFQIRS